MPNQTKKTAAAQDMIKRKLQKRAEDEKARAKADEDRERRVRESTEDLRAELNRRVAQGDAQRVKPRDPKQLAAEGAAAMREQLKRLKQSVAKAVAGRRFLFDQYKVDARKKAARKKALEKIGAAVFDTAGAEEQGAARSRSSSRGSGGGAAWKTAARKDEHRLLSQGEKEEMELYYSDDGFEDDEDDGSDSKRGD